MNICMESKLITKKILNVNIIDKTTFKINDPALVEDLVLKTTNTEMFKNGIKVSSLLNLLKYQNSNYIKKDMFNNEIFSKDGLFLGYLDIEDSNISTLLDIKTLGIAPTLDNILLSNFGKNFSRLFNIPKFLSNNQISIYAGLLDKERVLQLKDLRFEDYYKLTYTGDIQSTKFLKSKDNTLKEFINIFKDSSFTVEHLDTIYICPLSYKLFVKNKKLYIKEVR